MECYRYNKPVLDFVPDFTAKVIENSRVLRIKLDDFRACLEGQFDTEYQTVSNGATPKAPHLAQYQYPNTLRLETCDLAMRSDSDSGSGSEHRSHRQMEHQLTDKIKHIFSKKHNTKRHGKYAALSRRDSHSAESPRNGPRTSRGIRSEQHREHRSERDRGQYALPSSTDRHHSNPMPLDNAKRGNIVRAVSDPTQRVGAHLPTPSNISDNSRRRSPGNMVPRHHQLSPNPNYRLNAEHNLSNVHHTAFDEETEAMQTIVEMDSPQKVECRKSEEAEHGNMDNEVGDGISIELQEPPQSPHVRTKDDHNGDRHQSDPAMTSND